MILPDRRWDPEIAEGLRTMIDRHGGEKPLAVFDWDNTCIRGDIGQLTLEALDAQDGGKRNETYEEMVEREGKPVAYPWCSFQLSGWTLHDAKKFAEKVITDALASGAMALRPEIHDLIQALKAHGFDVWVVSASAEPLVQACVPLYGIAESQVLGMRLAVEDGLLQPRLAGPTMFREGKVEAIDAFIGRRPLFGIGDAETDIEMLDSARYRLVMASATTKKDPIYDHARRAGWWIQPVTW